MFGWQIYQNLGKANVAWTVIARVGKSAGKSMMRPSSLHLHLLESNHGNRRR